MHLRSSAFSPIILLYFLWISTTVRAYIPAIPTNDTESAIQSGLNVTDVSMLSLLWFENGYVPLHPTIFVGVLDPQFRIHDCTVGPVRTALTSPTSWWGPGAMALAGCVVCPQTTYPLTETDSQGALVHFSERNLTNDTSMWISFPSDSPRFLSYRAPHQPSRLG